MALRAFQFNPSIGGFGGESNYFGNFEDERERGSGKDGRIGQFGQLSLLSSNVTHDDDVDLTDRRAANASARMQSNASSFGGFNKGNRVGRRDSGRNGSNLSNGGIGDGMFPPSSSQSQHIIQHNIGNHFNGGSSDAFAQIVKELVDNAVDACAPSIGDDSRKSSNTGLGVKRKDNTKGASNSTKVIHGKEESSHEEMKRVRVKIESEQYRQMEVLRITVSDTGCGMANIDECVTVFSSNKNGKKSDGAKGSGVGGGGIEMGKASAENPQDNDVKRRKNKGDGKKNARTTKKSTSTQTNARKDNSNNANSTDRYTAGRYGVGLTLCLLHAQRLVPGSCATIVSATASTKEYVRASYVVDTEQDEIKCVKRELLPKGKKTECGTAISLLVPGGDEARNAWPRLAEYFARFQLSSELPCSLEVVAPTLSSIPLFIRPPSELERRLNRRQKKVAPPTVDLLIGSNDASDSCDVNASKADDGSGDEENEETWDDGFEEANENTSDKENDESSQNLPNKISTKSKAAQERARAEEAKKKKISLLQKAAQAYSSKPVRIENIAYTTEPIRRRFSGASPSSISKGSYSVSGPTLEMSMIVIGPDFCDNDNDDGYQESGAQYNGNKQENSAILSVVRMVNGIPLLDSPEALACGVVQKISNNNSTWNSFGLDLALKKRSESGSATMLGGRSFKQFDADTPTFSVEDSAQVAPFFRNTTHSLFQEQSQGYDLSSSSDEDDFDCETIRRKRKKERNANNLLPASLRLGQILMIVQIRAKPSALPLPTLSKGRLPMNDKGIDDALENGMMNCLRSLQRSNPDLLLTAQQLKRVERDAKYVPAIASAMASVLCNSLRSGVKKHALNTVSRWEDAVDGRDDLSFSNNHLQATQRQERSRYANIEKNDLPRNGQFVPQDNEIIRTVVLAPILEKRLRFVISEEYKDAKKTEERERKKKDREETAAAAKKARSHGNKRVAATVTDGMKSDCFDSDDSSSKCPSYPSGSQSTRSSNSKGHDAPSNDGFDSDTIPCAPAPQKLEAKNRSAFAHYNDDEWR